MTCLTGTSPGTATSHASPSMNATIPPTSMQTGGSGNCSSDPVKRSSCEPVMPTLFSFGDASLTTADRRELIALFSATKVPGEVRTLSDRLTPSLITSGLVSGITPSSVRQQCGAPIPDFVLLLPGGDRVEQRAGACAYSKGRPSPSPTSDNGEG